MNSLLDNPTFKNAALLVGRVLLSLIFITAGWGKIFGYAETAAYMEHMGVPSLLLPLVIFTEFGVGLCILAGFQTRIAAIWLAGFCLASGYLFHWSSAQALTAQMAGVTDAAQLAALAQAKSGQMINLWKNICMAGGFLALFAAGAGAWSVDGRRSAA